ncbi:NAD(P)-binding protein [Ramicandelaber brevisporus]|nr:NAD(P)-binding protein [Ramicandelaber brevisporus]
MSSSSSLARALPAWVLSAPRLDGKLAVITGASDGIGRQAAKFLAARGATVVMAARNAEKTQAAIDTCLAECPDITAGQFHFMPLELQSLDSVRQFADHFSKSEVLSKHDGGLNLLINNAGVMNQSGLTQDGFENTFGINHLGHFLLTNLLTPSLKRGAPSRVITVASRAHERSPEFDLTIARDSSRTGWPAYTMSKACNISFARELARRLKGTGVTSYSLHPGVIGTSLWRNLPWPLPSVVRWFMTGEEDGAKTTFYLATSDELTEEMNGKYIVESQPHQVLGWAATDKHDEELWKYSEENTASK